MSRRDTIIIAVLVNAALLVILFTTALKTNRANQDLRAAHEESNPSIPSEITLKQDNATRGFTEENKQILNMPGELQTTGMGPDALPVNMAPPIVHAQEGLNESTNFADEIRSFTSPEQATAISPPPVEHEVTAAETFAEIKVKKGDVLEKIARSHKTTVSEIMRLNQLRSTNLKIGQVLKIPKKEGRASLALHSSASDKETRYYTVKNGDNPWTIAMKNHMRVEELLKLNNLNEEKAKKLKPGDQLKIR